MKWDGGSCREDEERAGGMQHSTCGMHTLPPGFYAWHVFVCKGTWAPVPAANPLLSFFVFFHFPSEDNWRTKSSILHVCVQPTPAGNNEGKKKKENPGSVSFWNRYPVAHPGPSTGQLISTAGAATLGPQLGEKWVEISL